MRRTIGYAAMLTATALLVAGAGAAGAGELPPHITKEDLAKDNKLFLSLASKSLKWGSPPSR